MLAASRAPFHPSHHRARALLAAFGAAVVGCQPRDADDGPPPDRAQAADLAAAHQAVRRADSAFAAASAAHDLEASVAAVAADGIMFTPEQPPVVGRAAVREHMRQAFAMPHFSVTWTTDTVVVASGGDLAYSYARSRFTFPSRSGQADGVDTLHGKGVRVWRREADGRWRAVADIWNGSPVSPPILPRDSSD